MIYPQMLLDLHDELIVDLFAGGGGASCGIEMALGRQVDIAVNHDVAAVALHKANHPQTHHERADVFEVDPRAITGGRPVGLLWASPDCTDHSKAKGGKPIRTRKRRALAWVVKRWAGTVKPRVIFLENVEEFEDWGPLIGPPGQLRRCPRRKGRTFRKFVRDLEALGYVVEWRQRRACDSGAPTIRKRLYMIARCDGQPIVWPQPTHGPGTRKRYRTAAECIDWTIPMLSIFATRDEARAWGKAHGQAAPVRPLAEATLRRIARGVMRYVVEAAEPFIVRVAHGETAPGGSKRWGKGAHPVGEPLPTVTSSNDFALAAPYLVPRYGEREGQEPRVRSIEEPAPVVVPTGNGASLCAAFLARHWGGMVGKDLREPHPTVLTKGAQDQLAAVHLSTYYGGASGDGRGAQLDEPLRTQGTENRHAIVAVFLAAYYGTHQDGSPADPLATVTTRDRFGLVTVTVEGQPYVIADIAMRMLQPRELYNAQGFPPEYAITVRFYDPEKKRIRWLTKTEQVRMVGNSVSPCEACALIAANVPELKARDEAAA